jgi:hypothetical protein
MNSTEPHVGRYAPRPRQGVPPGRGSDVGAIPPEMISDLRKLLWRMEKSPKYWGITMAIVIGSIFISGIIFFATHTSAADPTSSGIGAVALAILAAMAYSPFSNWWFESSFEARWLREALYSQRLEDLASHMAACRFGSRNYVADELLKIWVKHRVEPGWLARPADPPPQFQ